MTGDLVVFAALGLAALLAVFSHKLTRAGGVAGFVSAALICYGSGYAGLISMTAFFVCGVWATACKQKEKAHRGISEENKGRRKASQVIANSGMAALVSTAGYLSGTDPLFLNIIVASAFSAATADTLSSELGNVYGKRFYNILTFRKDQHGLDGVISIEGTLAGIAGSLLIAMICFAFYPTNETIIVILIAGTAGNLADSVLGAALERKGKIKNDLVNFLNTLVAVLVAWLLILSELFV